MKKKKEIFKGAGALLIMTILLIANISVMAKTIDSSTNIAQIDNEILEGSLGQFMPSVGEEIIIEENFEDKDMPPDGIYGKW